MIRLTTRAYILLALGVLLVVLGIGWGLQRRAGSTQGFRTAAVSRGDLLVTINATGTVEPEEVINVGAQVAGQILAFGQDVEGRSVDYGSVVEAGTVLARIDDSLYQADAAQAEAQVASAQANRQRSGAELAQARTKLALAERDWQRAGRIGPGDALSQSQFDAYRAAFETAQSGLAVAEAGTQQTDAAVQQAEATLARARRNLGYCTIKAPVRGVVIDRRVNIGQTVVASLNAPSLFLLAKDLRRIQVWVAVNEADIGRIRVGLPVRFTVDALPGESFRGEVGKIRLNASMTQNVVTYTVEIVTDNESGRLLPYLTANVEFELERVADELQVSNAALRWLPNVEQVAAAGREEFARIQARRQRAGSASRTSRDGTEAAKKEEERGERGVLWLPDGGKVRPLRVRLGQSDGNMTVVQGEGLAEGQSVVLGVQGGAAGTDATQNPFGPKFPGRGSNQGKGSPGGGGAH